MIHITDFVFDTEKLKELMNDFYNLTKIRIVIFDTGFNKVLSVPDKESSFCTLLKANSDASCKCKECDSKAFKHCKKINRLYIYRCHSGLTEAVSPLMMNDIHLGYIMFGQIIDKSDKKLKKDEILAYAKNYTDVNLEPHFERLTAKKTEQINSAAKIMETCACCLFVREMIRLDNDSIGNRLTDYIRQNLQADLSINTLCTHFGISRNRLYKISWEYLGMGIAKYIRQKRVERATALLKEGASVAEASSLSGFYDYNYFSKIYKAQTGVLPSKMKKR